MKTLQRYKLTALVALLAFLPIVYRAFPNQPIWVQVGVAVIIALVAGLIEHYRNVQPQLKLEDKKTYLFGYTCDNAFAKLRGHDQTARLNIMEIDRRILDRWSVFEIVFSRGMENEPDKDLGLKLGQGVCGQAVSQRGFCVADLEVPHGPTFNLDNDQLNKTKDLTLVLSMPIKRAKKMPDDTFTLTDDIVGVVNIDSKMKGALGFYENTIIYETAEDEGLSLLQKQTEVLQEISEVCSYIVS